MFFWILSSSLSISVVFAEGGGVPPGMPPEPIIDLAIPNTTETSMTIRWTVRQLYQNPGEEFFYTIIYRNETLSPVESTTLTADTHPSIVPPVGTAGQVQTTTIPGLTPGQRYRVWVYVHSSIDGVSNYSYGASATLPGGNGDGGSSSSQLESQPPDSVPGTGMGGIKPRSATFSGRAFPGGSVELLVKNTASTEYAELLDTRVAVAADGTFNVSASPLLGKEYFFALKAKDKDGHETGLVAFPADFTALQEFSKTDIFFPPTLGFDDSAVSRKTDVVATGYASPESSVFIQLNGKDETTIQARKDGKYSYTIPADKLPGGVSRVRVKQKDAMGVESSFSRIQEVRVSDLILPEADFNSDNRINIIDWSIFLASWGSDDPEEQRRADLNKDGTVSIGDFGIFLGVIVEDAR